MTATPTRRSAVHRALAQRRYRQRKVAPLKGKGAAYRREESKTVEREALAMADTGAQRESLDRR